MIYKERIDTAIDKIMGQNFIISIDRFYDVAMKGMIG